MVRAFEQQPEVALQLAVVGREDDVDLVIPAAGGNRAEGAPEGLVDELALDRVSGVDLPHLVGSQRRGHPLRGRLVVGDEGAVVPEAPVARLRVEDRLALGRRLRVAVGQGHVAPVESSYLGLRRVPRVMGVGEAHPAEPVVVGVERVEPRDRAVCNPVAVVPLPWDRVDLHLRRPGLAAARPVHLQVAVDDCIEAADHLRMLCL